MERQNKPPPLSIPVNNPTTYFSALSYHKTPYSSYAMPNWAASSRRRNLRRSLLSCNNTAGVMFIAFLVVTGTLTWLLLQGGTGSSSPLSQLPDSPSKARKPVILDSSDSAPTFAPIVDPNVANSTLNFQQIFAINLPSRLDRKDILTVMATYSNISITIVPGVKSVAENALPPPRTPGSLRPEEYSVWRAHANLWRRMIEQNINTALILEDDNDWDINLKQQIPRILRALDEIRKPAVRDEQDGVVRGGQESEPWDMLYLGSCMETTTLEDQKNRKVMVPIPSDRENVAEHNYNWVEEILRNHKHSNPPIRILQRTSFAQCTHAYALTQHGARKLLYHTSLNLDKRLDMAIADLVNKDVINAFSVIPPIMVQWKTEQRASKDTDVGYDVWPVRNWGFAHSLRYTLRRENQVGFDPDGD